MKKTMLKELGDMFARLSPIGTNVQIEFSDNAETCLRRVQTLERVRKIAWWVIWIGGLVIAADAILSLWKFVLTPITDSGPSLKLTYTSHGVAALIFGVTILLANKGYRKQIGTSVRAMANQWLPIRTLLIKTFAHKDWGDLRSRINASTDLQSALLMQLAAISKRAVAEIVRHEYEGREGPLCSMARVQKERITQLLRELMYKVVCHGLLEQFKAKLGSIVPISNNINMGVDEASVIARYWTAQFRDVTDNPSVYGIVRRA